ncbi:rhamnogalacturonan acetylesterase [Aestuariivivens sediminis]|uniref:rhamnogalacturonan acetylesterase n=1 Tax=Aestuariivivens sediminis TaxID=2913557 RepID=UPI001F5A7E6D|nr:rhamnogalacturonan acetylesterase [Aestuariivivens sediminis]
MKTRRSYQMIILLLLISAQSCFAQQTTIYMIGDSTMANKKNPEINPEHGWGQVLDQFFTDDVNIDNRAVNGRSTRSFIAEGRWNEILKILKKGDYVFIQFGHNDQKVNSPKRYTNPHTAYRNNLIQFIKETREKEAIPILFTSIVRRNFNEDSTLVDTHGVYPLEVRLVAQEYGVTLVDLQYLSEQLEESYGVEGSKQLHLHFAPNEHAYYPQGKADDTHLSLLGATKIAELAVNALEKKVEGFGRFIKRKRK